MRLPPLNAVRVFEAAGRLENFSKAAAELKVTPGAVSRQVRKLEEHIGASLFARVGTDVRLTPEGRLYLGSVQDALEVLEAGTQRINVKEGTQPLHIWGSRFFIRLWLVPRLPDFHKAFADQEVMITSALPSDPMPGSFDVAVKLGDGNWPGYRADLLIPRVLVPVCSPAYLRANPAAAPGRPGARGADPDADGRRGLDALVCRDGRAGGAADEPHDVHEHGRGVQRGAGRGRRRAGTARVFRERCAEGEPGSAVRAGIPGGGWVLSDLQGTGAAAAAGCAVSGVVGGAVG